MRRLVIFFVALCSLSACGGRWSTHAKDGTPFAVPDSRRNFRGGGGKHTPAANTLRPLGKPVGDHKAGPILMRLSVMTMLAGRCSTARAGGCS